MKRTPLKNPLLALAAGLLALAGLTGCEIDSAEKAIRQVGLIVAGFYTGVEGAPIVARNTGNPITTLNLRQSGDQLEGIDNNGQVFRGTIGTADQSNATITLKGTTTAGQEGVISGSISVSGSNGNMRGTWIEPSLTSSVFAQATDVPVSDPDDSGNNGGGSGGLTARANPTSVTLGSTSSLTASGGTGPYSWTTTNGSISPTSGTTVTFTPTTVGIATVTLRDTSTGETDTVSITITSSGGGSIIGPPTP